jgi:cell division protein FtsQ
MIVANKKRGASRLPVRKERQPFDWKMLWRSLIVVGFVAMSTVGGYVLYLDDTLPIRHVTVEGDFKYVDKQLFVETVTPFATGSFMNVDVASLREAGETLPWVKQLQIRRVWPDSLHFIVEEHEAVARWGESGLLSRNGLLFYPAKASFPEGLPVLNGPEQHYQNMAVRFATMQKVLKQKGLQLEELTMDKRTAWSFVLTNGMTVKLGRVESDKRFMRFINTYEHGLKQYESDIAVMDMRYTNGLAVQWKEDKTPDFNGTV